MPRLNHACYGRWSSADAPPVSPIRSPTADSGKLHVMLEDKDRIFRNLYGLQDWGLEAARRRGAWDRTKAIIHKGRDWIIAEMQARGPAGPGGAGLSTVRHVALPPQRSTPARRHE